MMVSEKYKIQVDGLAVGLTRPPMFMGVDLRIFFFNVMFWTLMCLYTNSMWFVVVGAAVYFFIRRMSVKEPLFLALWVKSISKTPPVPNSSFWGGVNSYEPW